MKKSASPHPAAERVFVWDRVVRIGHWTLVAAFALSYFYSRKFPLHALTGYLIFAIVCWRIVWGFIGSRYARFSAFLYPVRETLAYTLSAFRFGPAREYPSHNPMGAIMVFVMLPTLIATCATGAMLYSAQQLSGPLGELVPTDWEDILQAIHGFLANGMAVLVVVHVTGVVWATWWHRENYVGAMFSGMKSLHKRRAKRALGGQSRLPD